MDQHEAIALRLIALHDALTVATEVGRAQAHAWVNREGFDPFEDVPDPRDLLGRLEQRYATMTIGAMTPAEFLTALDEFSALAVQAERWREVEQARKDAKQRHLQAAHEARFPPHPEGAYPR
jgi:hypothetical protein